MIRLLPEPLDGESVETGLPLIILALTHDIDGQVSALTVGDEGEARLIPWTEDTLKIPWRFDHARNEWVDNGPLLAMSKKAAGETEEEPEA